MSVTATGERPPRVQAATVRAREAYVLSKHGAAARDHFRRSASPELEKLLSSPTNPPGGWCPFSLFIEANVLADRLFGNGDLSLVWEIGRFAASHNLGVWKGLFMRHATPAMFMGIATGLWSHHYEGGRLASRPGGLSSLIVSILDFPAPHTAHCKSIGGWMQGSLELGPRKNIVVEELSCRTRGAAICEFRGSWA